MSGEIARALRPGEVLSEYFESIESHAEHGREVSGVATGFDDLDRLTGGLQACDLILVAGASGTGKSALVLGIGAYIARAGEGSVLYVDALSPPRRIIHRLLAAEGRIDASRLRVARLEDTDWRKLGDAMGFIAEWPLYMLGGRDVTVDAIEEQARALPDLTLIVADSLGMLAYLEQREGDQRWESATRVVHRLKQLALALEVPVVLTTGVKQGHLSRTDKRPQLSDISETFTAAEIADLVLLLYRDELYDEDSPDKGIAEVIAAKHRDGYTGVVKVAFLNHLTKFANLARPAQDPSTLSPRAQ